ncbi:MAG: amidohydrolase [Pseudohongiellaceae bacterium]
MSELSLTLIQTDLKWQDAAANRQLLDRELAQISKPTDLIILPEMFTSAFAMDNRAIAEPHPGPTVDWMLRMAKEKNAALSGSIAVLWDGDLYNRLLFVTPEQDVWFYDKRHLFRMLGEHKRYNSGSAKLLVHWRGWRILPLVCYDLRFPVWCRNTPGQAYDLMLFVANWPAQRTDHWTTLLKARAIENLAYVAGVNRIGKDGKGLDYDGASAVFDASGSLLLDAGKRQGSCSVTISQQALEEYRNSFPAFLDADSFSIN